MKYRNHVAPTWALLLFSSVSVLGSASPSLDKTMLSYGNDETMMQ